MRTIKNPCKKCKYGITVNKNVYTESFCGLLRDNCKKLKKFEEFKETRRKYEKSEILVKTLDEFENYKFYWVWNKAISKKFLENMKPKEFNELLEKGMYVAVKKRFKG